MSNGESIQPGIYRHYKGNNYEVYEVAIHSETLETLVVYRPLYGDKKLWVRPLSMFLETVELNGVSVSRFELIEPHNSNSKSSPSQINGPQLNDSQLANSKEEPKGLVYE